MKKVYINGTGCISAQETFENTTFLEEIKAYNDVVIKAVDPNYKEYIAPAAARRMAKGIKMGIVASKLALEEAHLANVDAIITGTGLGCGRDSEKFLNAILDNDEQYLTPTAFIQSTHNTVGGQIALEIGCKGYNFTYVHASVSFESALLDAMMQLQTNEANSVLIGGVDELADKTVEMHKMVGFIKETPLNSLELLQSTTTGSIASEGASFFVLENSKTASSYAEVVAVNTINTLAVDDVEAALIEFLNEQQLELSSIDAVVLGANGDVEFGTYYQNLSNGILAELPVLTYKQLSGEFYTASSFGCWLAAKILKTKTIPESVVQQNKPISSELNTILLYNQYRGENHSFTLLKSC